MKKTRKKKKKMRLKISKFTILIALLDILCIGLLLLIYTNDKFTNYFITTAMTTKSHKYLAYTLYSKETIDKVIESNYIETTTEKIKLDDIIIGSDNMFTKKYNNQYEKELFTKDPGNDVYKTIRIIEPRYKGWLVGIYDPSDVKLSVSSRLGRMGDTINKMVKDHNALVGINGGGFEDLDGWGNGSITYGAIIENCKLIWTHAGGSGELIGFTKEHKLWLTNDDPHTAISKGMVEAVEFGPNLIVNGKAMTVHGDGGWGVAPRTVIAQRKDGVVLFLIIEGRLPGYSIGASMNDVISILKRYKAYNAANLDGGASSTMSVEGKLWNRPSAGGEYGGRTLSNGWIVTNTKNKKAQAPQKENYK